VARADATIDSAANMVTIESRARMVRRV